MPAVRTKIVFDCEGTHVEIGGPTVMPGAHEGEAERQTVADFGRWVKIAACVASCIASVNRMEANDLAAERGGQHSSPPSG